MRDVYICDYIRTPIGRYGGSLSSVRADDPGAIPLRALTERHPRLDWEAVVDVIYGCANQAGEDRNPCPGMRRGAEGAGDHVHRGRSGHAIALEAV